MDRDKQEISITLTIIKKKKKKKSSLLDRDSALFPGQLSPCTLSSKKATLLSFIYAIWRVGYNYAIGAMPAILLHRRIHLERVYTHLCQVQLGRKGEIKGFQMVRSIYYLSEEPGEYNHFAFAMEMWNSDMVRQGLWYILHVSVVYQSYSFLP